MKIAYLILAHRNPRVLKKAVEWSQGTVSDEMNTAIIKPEANGYVVGLPHSIWRGSSERYISGPIGGDSPLKSNSKALNIGARN